MSDVEYIRSKLTSTPDFPKKVHNLLGINFLDFLPILRDHLAFETLITHFVHHITSKTVPSLASNKKIDAIVGLDSRGFLIGPIIALRLGAKFVPVRKVGKLPGKTLKATYQKEYGEDAFEIQEGAIEKGDTVIVVDDLIATGGSAKAAGDLVAQSGGKTVEYLFVIALTFLKGGDKLDAPSYSIIESDD